jgi:hypothetical protein
MRAAVSVMRESNAPGAVAPVLQGGRTFRMREWSDDRPGDSKNTF